MGVRIVFKLERPPDEHEQGVSIVDKRIAAATIFHRYGVELQASVVDTPIATASSSGTRTQHPLHEDVVTHGLCGLKGEGVPQSLTYSAGTSCCSFHRPLQDSNVSTVCPHHRSNSADRRAYR